LSLEKGLLAEEKSVKFLEKRGFEILTRNYHTRYGEIDIIAKHGNTLHFIEVKSGRNFNPIQNMTEKKLEKILKSAEIFLQKRDRDELLSVDLITVQKEQIELFENISI
jgi:putative endonuclease